MSSLTFNCEALKTQEDHHFIIIKAGYTATLVACGWAGAVLEKVTGSYGQEPYAQKAQKRRKSKKGTDQPTN